MKRGVALLAFLVIVTVIGGILTSNMWFQLPFERQTAEPMASVFEAPGEKAVWLFAMIAFILVNVIGAGLTIALVFWFLNREVKIANATPNRNANASGETAITTETKTEAA